jgi:hypothetical protein
VLRRPARIALDERLPETLSRDEQDAMRARIQTILSE